MGCWIFSFGFTTSPWTVQDVGLHARHVSTVSTVDSGNKDRSQSSCVSIIYLKTNHWLLKCNFLVELIDDSGNPIWKNRVESWKEKDKKKKKKKDAPKPEKEAPIPQEQQMEEIQ